MESNSAIIDFVTGVMPDKLADTNVVLCCVKNGRYPFCENGDIRSLLPVQK